jgi:3-oxoacyl-(acyl-carrier-protein) synthase
VSPWLTGLGVVHAHGFGKDALLEALLQGRSGLRPLSRFQLQDLPAWPVGLVPGFEGAIEGPGDHEGAWELARTFAHAAGEEALAGADLDRGELGLILGTNLEEAGASLHELACSIAERLGLGGPVLVVSVACASGTAALGLALELLGEDLPAVLAGGVDVITPTVYAGFQVLGAMSSEGCAPFSQPEGMSLGDGAGLFLVETPEHARGRGAQPIAALRGVGRAADAHHATQPAPDGRGVQQAVIAALEHAGLGPRAVQHVNAHGTGTQANDAAEVRGLEAALGPRPTSSMKGLLGHAQGAAGALELACSLLLRDRGLLPPTVGFGAPRPGAPGDPVPVLREGPSELLLSCNSAFGGVNVALVVGPPGERPSGRRTSRASATCSLDVEQAEAAVRGVDRRRLDLSGLLICATVQDLCRQAGLRLSRRTCRRLGLIVAQDRVSPESLGALQASIEESGLGGMSAAAFARSLLVAPAGACSRELGLRGPVEVISAGPDSPDRAEQLARIWLAQRPGLDAVITVLVSELEGSRGRLFQPG